MPTTCFHCGEQVPPEERGRTITVQGREEPVCCAGCEAVANLILGSGLGDFYRFRERLPGQPEQADLQAQAEQWAVYDRDDVQRDFVHTRGDGLREGGFLFEGLYCAACGWLIERVLTGWPGVDEAHVNPATGRGRIAWDPEQVALSQILAELARIGYRAHPVRADTAQSLAADERRRGLRRLAVAGLGMMQVMMFAVGLYAGDYYGIDPLHQEFLRWVSLLVATPVVLYAGFPFFHGLYRDLRARSPGMDVPVGLAIGAVYLASVHATITGGAEVYFDSATMFVFLLLCARYVEMLARHRANETADALASLVPATATRIGSDGDESVPVQELAVGDEVRIRPGETVPADGRILAGEASIDEALLTGETLPRTRGPGDAVVGGSVNVNGSLRVRIEALGADTVLSGIARLLERAQSDRPRIARLADWVARRFVAAVLTIAVAVGLFWWQYDPERAFLVVMAVLIATCPCALAMATPMALAGGTSRLARAGLLVTRRDALEGLARADTVVFDKTGTLTQGALRIDRVECFGSESERRCLAIASALELHSEHPIARSFVEAAGAQGACAEAQGVSLTRGAGIEGEVEGKRYRIGAPAFAAALAGVEPPAEATPGSYVVLADAGGVVARFRLSDRPRKDAAATVAALQEAGLHVEIASGDDPAVVGAVAADLGVSRWQGRLQPEQKLARIRQLQAEGRRVVMVGDGVNDAPVLAGADTSVAMNSGTSLAQTSADMVLLGERLEPLAEGVIGARRTLRIMKQNLSLSAGYNGSALPLAAVGFLTPWMGALGMTISSLVVVLNAGRLIRGQRGLPGEAMQTAGAPRSLETAPGGGET